jgi:hypothetical protein
MIPVSGADGPDDGGVYAIPGDHRVWMRPKRSETGVSMGCVVAVSHSPEAAAEIARRLALFDAGQVLAEPDFDAIAVALLATLGDGDVARARELADRLANAAGTLGGHYAARVSVHRIAVSMNGLGLAAQEAQP